MFWVEKSINQSIKKKIKKGSFFPRPNRPRGDCYEFPTAIPSNAILTCGVPSLSIRGTRWSGAYLASRRFMRTSKRSPSVKRAANSEMRGGSGDPRLSAEFAQSCPPATFRGDCGTREPNHSNEGPVMQRREGWASAVSAAALSCPKRVPVTEHSC